MDCIAWGTGYRYLWNVEPPAYSPGSASCTQLLRLVPAWLVYWRARSGAWRPDALLRGRSQRWKLHGRLLPHHDVWLACRMSGYGAPGAYSQSSCGHPDYGGAYFLPDGCYRAD